MHQRVHLGLSGGVDSSVSAYLLKQRGFDVHAVFMVNWKEKGACDWEEDLRHARAVAKKLSIPLQIWDFAKEYREFVFKDFISAYKRGLTPNPDVFCNKYIKFGAFYDRARREGADFVATGHYARIMAQDNTLLSLRGSAKQSHYTRLTRSPRSLSLARDDNSFFLCSATDKTKDQSDFLYQIKPSQLRHILFPIGGMLKKDVKRLARDIGLPNWDKPESMGVCFIGEMNMKKFLQKYIPPAKGEILDTNGKTLGQHEGVWYYTLGQREGLNIGGTGPYFVVKKYLRRNVLVVASKQEARRLLAVKKVYLTHTNFLIPKSTLRVLWRDRHLSPLEKGILKEERKKWYVEFDSPKRGVAPGQSLVMYDVTGEKVAGGGVIARLQ